MTTCECGNTLDRRNKSGRCEKCVRKNAARRRARPPETDYLRDVPQPTKAESRTIDKAGHDGVPTDAADAIIKRSTEAIKQAKLEHGVYHT